MPAPTSRVKHQTQGAAAAAGGGTAAAAAMQATGSQEGAAGLGDASAVVRLSLHPPSGMESGGREEQRRAAATVGGEGGTDGRRAVKDDPDEAQGTTTNTGEGALSPLPPPRPPSPSLSLPNPHGAHSFLVLDFFPPTRLPPLPVSLSLSSPSCRLPCRTLPCEPMAPQSI